jgi:signal transduction histidine kinase
MNAPVPPKEPTARLRTILIVDDDVHLAASLALGLESNGYRTLHAANATQGWDLARAHLPDLILSDIEMPGKDGRRFLQEMRADPELGSRQFVLMTGRIPLGNPRTAMDLGADDFLLKPFTLTELLRCVEARLKRADLSRRIDDNALARLQVSLRSTLPHEFFTPLASVMGLTELLLLDLDKLPLEEVRQDLRTIQTAGRRLHRTLRNYLLILELEPTNLERRPPWLGAQEVAEAMVNGATTAAERHCRGEDLKIEVEGARLPANPLELATLMEELVDNALTYSRKTTPVVVKVRREGPVLQVVVTDAGRGMTPQQLQSLDNYWQRPREVTRRQDNGLGLVLVRRLVQHLGGEFRLESRDGVGTSAFLTLPIRGE